MEPLTGAGRPGRDRRAAAARPDRLFLHAADGVFADATPLLPPFVLAPIYAALFDVDGDGALDVITAKSSTAATIGVQNHLYLGSSGGPFTDVTATHLPVLADKTLAVAAGDVDGDGDLDVLFGNRKEQDRLLRNDGTGVLLESTADLPPDEDQTETVLLADFDADGDLDALTSNAVDEPNRLLVNDGQGHFAEAAASLPEGLEHARGAAAGDIDLDLDLDLVLAITGEDGALRNLVRQVAHRGVVKLGKPTQIDVHGEPLAPWFLAWSTSAVSFPLPPFGLLQLDPAALVVDSSGFLGASGVVTRSFVAPPDAVWAGFTVHWQQISGWSLQLSNRDRMLLYDL